MAICVTGGSSGLGRAIAERFAPDGTDVFINYHANDEAAAEAEAAVAAAGGVPHLIKADVGTEEGCAEVIAAVRDKVDRLDQLVHGAAKAQTGSLLGISSADLRDSIAVNGIALVDLVREALPMMGQGSTVFYLTSRGARFVIPNYGSLGTAKALGEHIVRYLARECAPQGVRVMSVSPGAVDTAAFRAMFPDTYEERLAAAAKANPMGRGVTVEDCAALVEMLANPELEMVQGQTITTDGGRLLVSLGLAGGSQDFPLTLTHVLGRARTVHRRAEVVSLLDAEGTTKRAPMSEVAARADCLAAGLRALGIGPGDRVGTYAFNSQEHLEAYYAVPCSGAVLHTLNPRLSPEQVAFTINHAGDRVVLLDAVLVPEMEKVLALLDGVERFVVIGEGERGALPADTLGYEELLVAGEEELGTAGFVWPALDERAAAALCYTSGTTGNPKGALYSHRALCLHTLMMAGHDAYRMSERDRILAVVPMFHAMGWNLGYLAGMVGADLVMPGRHVQSEHLARLIAEERVTATCGVPTIWMDLLRQPGADLSSLELAICGGTQVPPALMREFEQRHGVKVVQGWGMTETLPGAALAHDPPRSASEEERWARREHAGRVSPFFEVRIVGAGDEVMPNDGETPGEVEIRGPTVIAEYFENPEASAAATHDGWLRTGDVGTLDEEGWLRITDRAKDVIKSGGEWISSVDLESALMAHPAVVEATVIALPDERWSERPLACVVAEAEVGPEELREFIAPRVAKWWLPDDFAYLEEIPKTSVGKFDKKVLREMLATGSLPGRRRFGDGSVAPSQTGRSAAATKGT